MVVLIWPGDLMLSHFVFSSFLCSACVRHRQCPHQGYSRQNVIQEIPVKQNSVELGFFHFSLIPFIFFTDSILILIFFFFILSDCHNSNEINCLLKNDLILFLTLFCFSLKPYLSSQQIITDNRYKRSLIQGLILFHFSLIPFQFYSIVQCKITPSM